MSIIYKRSNENKKLSPTDYVSEDELQKLISESPEILMYDNEPMIALVQREVSLGDAGYLDILLIDSEGRPTAVEVKLVRNSEIRRQVVGQIFDYVSALTQSTVDELDQKVGHRLYEAIRSFSTESGDDVGFESRWQSCGTNLRAGQVRVVVAVDNAPEELVRIVRFINDHSDLDVRLVSIKKYVTDSGEVILVPSLLVYGRGSRYYNKQISVIRPEFQEVISTYTAIAPKGYEPRGKGKYYRLIYPDSWPWQVHYEFLDDDGKINLCIHLEGDNVRQLANTIKSFETSILALIPNATVQWNTRWSKSRGALEVIFDQCIPTQKIAEAMKTLIEHTKDTISEELKKLTESNNND